jgi:hypothetical protein
MCPERRPTLTSRPSYQLFADESMIVTLSVIPESGSVMRHSCIAAGALDMYGEVEVVVRSRWPINFALAEDVETIGADEPVVLQLLLHAEGELLEQRMMRVRAERNDANAAGLVRAGER